MTLQPGTRLGPYEVIAPLGSGGMGEVYRARDTRLNRDVAIKILPSRLAGDPTRRARFAREARSISQLSHPNICTIYDVGDTGDIAFLVMEHIEGESLERRLRLGPIPWATALPWAAQMAAALQAAHRRGVIHRDLKPANVMIAESGVKLLDFGLAKLLDADGGAALSTESLTAEQHIVGTINYMSPEQLEGRDVDARTDIFAFGATLYEMITARKAFAGATPGSVSAAILASEPPPLSSSSDGLPAGLEHIVRRAIAKDPDERWQTARDLVIELNSLQQRGARSAPWSTVARWRKRLLLATSAIAIGVAGVVFGWRLGLLGREPVRQAPVVFTIAAPQNTRLAIGFGMMAASPDGRKIAFCAGPEGGPKSIWWQSLDATVAHPLGGTEGGDAPFWSPDSQSIGYYAPGNTQLKRVGINGTAPEVILDLAPPHSGATAAASWADDDTILFGRPGGVYRVKATGGLPVQVASTGSMPRALPSGRFLYLVPQTRPDNGVKVAGAGLAAAVGLPITSNAVYAAASLVYREGSALVARPFDMRTQRFAGAPVTLAESVGFNPLNERANFDASDDLLLYRTPSPRRLIWRDRNDRPAESMGAANSDWDPVLAPDGSGRVAVDRHGPQSSGYHIWVIDTNGRSIQVTNGVRERWPTWSPDGKSLIYWTQNADTMELRRQSADGRAPADVLLQQSEGVTPLDVSRDGRWLLYQSGMDLWVLSLTDLHRRQITDTPDLRETTGRFSVDGRWIAFAATDSAGQSNVWVQEFPGGGHRRPISVDGGLDPSWRADGKELFYVARGDRLIAVPVTPGQELAFGTPVPLFTFQNLRTIPLHLYAASHDGQRFLVDEFTGDDPPITVILHWSAFLK